MDTPDNTTIIPLTQGYVTIVDQCDADLAALKWHVHIHSTCIYAQRTIQQRPTKRQLLHRLILGRKIGRELTAQEYVDHIDGNGLNNRRSNLRIATRAENQRNRGKQSNNTSGYKGVTWRKKAKKWVAQIIVNKENIYLGYYDTPEEAYAAYCKAAIQYHGEYARFE